jgi:hypothetical protein
VLSPVDSTSCQRKSQRPDIDVLGFSLAKVYNENNGMDADLRIKEYELARIYCC